MFYLEMKASQRPFGRAAVIVLDERRINAGRRKLFGLPRFQEKTAVIAEDSRLDQHHIFERGVLKLHFDNITAARAP
jgi:hypothetical protein